MIETLADTRSLFAGSGVEVYLGAGNQVEAIFDQVFDESLEVAGRRTGVRLPTVDADLIAIDATITVKDSYTDPITETDYIVRAKETGQRTTLLILEST